MSTHSHSNRQPDERDRQGQRTTSRTHSLVLSLSMAIAQKTTETKKRIVASLGPLSAGLVVEQSIRQESVKRRRCGTMPAVRQPKKGPTGSQVTCAVTPQSCTHTPAGAQLLTPSRMQFVP